MRVQIMSGKMIEGLEIEGCFTIVSFALRGVDGALATFSYTGEAHVENSVMRIVAGASVYDYEVLPASDDEQARLDGIAHGMKQKRLTLPKNKSAAFLDGWREAYAARKAA